MKNKFTLLILLSTAVITITSCVPSRSKVGCPATAQVSHRYKF